ncbi:GNAT family N-acetyltransferase [Blastopirellula sp. J2-11]|uniref:GNAT family N-acetyltransferase n=1 Tax=Blastopirellula sp. J2-11 TaxID=2943192 RepID=UPI0021C766D3|nr:GNAT family N-acetyltransferase [Blastopirellula sp. J2-11]UUO08878.1 GNAT family N-acetyltransferase [Blastopirellula sp. J2-11]
MDFCFLSAEDAPRLRNVPSDLFANSMTITSLEQFLADPRHYICVVFVEGIAIGFASGVHLAYPDKPAEFFISEVAVTAAWRDADVATALLERLLVKARELNCNSAWSLTTGDNQSANTLFRKQKGVAAHDLVQYSIPLDDLVDPLSADNGIFPRHAYPPLPHPSPVKSLNFLLDLHIAEKSGHPPGMKLAEQIATEFLPEDEMEAQLENWRNLGWRWKFSLGERSCEGVFSVLINPMQALLQIETLDSSNYFGAHPRLSIEELTPLREKTERCLEKLSEVAKFEFSADGFPEASFLPDRKAMARSLKKRDDAQQTGWRRPIDKELNFVYYALLTPIRPNPGSDDEPIRRIDVLCMHGLIFYVFVFMACTDQFFAWQDRLWLVPLCALFFGVAVATLRKRTAWITITLSTFGWIYVFHFLWIALFYWR